jgi:exopolysaccharide biosynthesis WecB/TagA/CpsF family protein
MNKTNNNRAITNSGQSSALPALDRTDLMGLAVVNESVSATLDWLCAKLDAEEPVRVAFLNAHCVNVAGRSPQYRRALSTAHAVLPDGSGIALALKIRGETLRANLNGTDLIPALCKRLAGSQHSVFLLGGRPGIAAAAAESLQAMAPGLRIAGTRDGYFAADAEDALIREVNASGADVVLVAMGVPAQDLWLERNAARLRATLTFGVGGLFDFLSGRIPRAPRLLRRLGLEWTYRLYQEPGRMWRRYLLGNPEFLARALKHGLPSPTSAAVAMDLTAKRMLDIAVAATGIALLSPVLLTVAAAIRMGSKGPAILRQTRIGENGAPFTLYKFRSMYHDAAKRRAVLLVDNTHGEDAVTFKIKRDPRVTPIGRLLRRSSIDELPQLLNVLNGTMSLVGPRPPLPAEVVRYTADHRRRLSGKPGITCLWQISGRSDIAFPRQVELDVEYLQRRSVLVDLKILALTVPAVLSARGAY